MTKDTFAAFFIINRNIILFSKVADCTRDLAENCRLKRTSFVSDNAVRARCVESGSNAITYLCKTILSFVSVMLYNSFAFIIADT
jgi:hypothetical protein